MTKTTADRNKSKRKSDELTSTKTTAANEIFASCNFASLGLSPSLSDQLKERLGFASPTQVQAQAIPVILSGRHVLVNAVTGSGKTIAYLAPIVHHLHKYDPKIQRSDGTFGHPVKSISSHIGQDDICNVMGLLGTLTRINFIAQVYEILQKLLHRFHWIVPGYIMGGENRAKEKARLRKGISILIATPGRLLDHLRHTSSFSHANLRWLIFDEADRILELGFGKDIEEILEILGSRQNRLEGKGSLASTGTEFQRQNVLLSATLNEKVNHLANISLENPVMVGLDEKAEGSRHVSLDSDDEDEHGTQVVPSSDVDYKLPPQLVQRYVKVPCGARLAVFLSILKNLYEREAGQKAVVFFSTRDAVDFHYSLLCGLRWPPSNSENESKLFFRGKTFRLHGKMAPEDRRTTFQTFKTEKSALLLCTDIAARGLDFPKVRCIVQYDSPGEASEYVHRVGRTARIGQRGDSLLFLQPVEADYLKELEKHGVSLSEYPLVKVLNSFPLPAADPKHHTKKFVAVDMHPWVMSLQRALESYISAEPTMMKLAKDAFLSWVRAYTAHRGDLKQIFMVRKLHLGHVAKSFALKELPSLVGGSFQKQVDKRKRLQKKQNPSGSKRRKISSKS